MMNRCVCVRMYVRVCVVCTYVCMSVCTHACDHSTCRGPRCLQWGIPAQTVPSSHTPPWSPPEPWAETSPVSTAEGGRRQ